MKRFLLLTALLLLVPQFAHGQTPTAITGLEVIAERQYAVDPTGNIETGSGEIFLASARVYLFASASDADSTWETLMAAESIERDLDNTDESVTFEKLEVDDIGDRAMVMTISADIDEDETGVFRTMLIQRDAMIVTVTAIAGSTGAAEIADDIATAMIEREPGDDDAVYDGNGESSGGVWNVFLPADADELGDLRAYADKETRPA